MIPEKKIIPILIVMFVTQIFYSCSNNHSDDLSSNDLLLKEISVSEEYNNWALSVNNMAYLISLGNIELDEIQRYINQKHPNTSECEISFEELSLFEGADKYLEICCEEITSFDNLVSSYPSFPHLNQADKKKIREYHQSYPNSSDIKTGKDVLNALKKNLNLKQ